VFGGEPLWRVPPLTACHSFCRLFWPKRVRTSGSRERPSVWLRYWPFKPETLGGSVALGNSREPPATTFLGRSCEAAKWRQVSGHAVKRLPSRRFFSWACTTPGQLLEVLIYDSGFSFLVRRSTMNIFAMLLPRSWFDRLQKMGKFIAVSA
jgi:hypothetical protein